MKIPSRTIGTIGATVVALWAIGASIDRLLWVNCGSGLAGWVGSWVTQEAGVVDCGGEGAEVKYSGGKLLYRCGNLPLWPFYLASGHGHSEPLQQWWESSPLEAQHTK